MADTAQRVERDDDGAGLSRRCDRARPSRNPAASATVRDGHTVLTFADRSTMTLLGVTRLDQVGCFRGGGSGRSGA